jgi:hypothetical protein
MTAGNGRNGEAHSTSDSGGESRVRVGETGSPPVNGRVGGHSEHSPLEAVFSDRQARRKNNGNGHHEMEHLPA